ncbi:MAG TPA: HlyD family efflux transporter periplasmic adaptor subunit [Sphingomicrobium sp.]|jgi:HlyD family secretion protein|nr:HlyD family efflux transporter periplasmic adaptor subunit [Sphingomicrobium sp.]
MNRFRAAIIIAVIIAAAAAAWLLLGGSDRQRMFSGYIEGDSLYLASPVAGTVASVAAVEGTRVGAGQPLFSVDPATLTAQGQQAEAGVAAAHTQIATAEANAQQAAAEIAAASAESERARRDLARLLSVRSDDPAAVAGKDVDAARSALKAAEARVAAARKTANARQAQVSAARAHAAGAIGSRREVQIRVNQLAPAAPAPARVDKVFFQPGEWVSANQPVVSLLPDNKVKVRFFVPEQQVARYRPGRKIHFSCDGCAHGLAATIRYVSPRPEFTPPIIFSRDSRDRLVFMVEAYPEKPSGLQPGLPVDVEPLP